MSDFDSAQEARQYGRDDGRADALAGREPTVVWSDDADEYNEAYRAAYDAALAEIAPDFVREVRS